MSNKLIKMRETFDPESVNLTQVFDRDGLVDCYAVCEELVWMIDKAHKIGPADLQNVYMRAKAAVGNAVDVGPGSVTNEGVVIP